MYLKVPGEIKDVKNVAVERRTTTGPAFELGFFQTLITSLSPVVTISTAKFNIKIYVMSTESIYAFRTNLRTNSNLFLYTRLRNFFL
jgi:hypothetical protein